MLIRKEKMLNTILKYLNLSNDEDLILPNLYLGNETSSLNTNFLKENNIKLIINCTKDLEFNKDYKCIKIRIPFKMIINFLKITKYLNILMLLIKFMNIEKKIKIF